MKKYFLLGIILLIGIFYFFSKKETMVVESPETIPSVEEIVPAKKILFSYTISEGDTFTSVIEAIGGSYSEALSIVAAASSTYDLTRIRLGRDVRYELRNGELIYIEYDIDTEEKILLEKNKSGVFEAKKETIAYDVENVTERATIASSLFVDGNKAGMSDALILEIAEILSWSVDFATAVQTGDSVVVYYEKRTRNGNAAPHGKVLAVSFTNVGKTVQGFLFQDSDGKDQYYDEQGNSLVRQFLKAPLKYNRISSGYTNARFHPVTQTTAPHRAIDYAAPVGTPILATADGVVTMAQYYGGFGNYIDIRHNSIYETQYAHLSKYAAGIKPGVRVNQGDVIGYVGSTGWSTGPHLHYQIRKNGTLVNPLEVELPAGDPVSEEKKEEFERVKAGLQKFLE